MEARENRQSQGGEKPRPHAPNRSCFVKPLPVKPQQVAGQEGGADGAPGEGHQSEDGRFHGSQKVGADDEQQAEDSCQQQRFFLVHVGLKDRDDEVHSHRRAGGEGNAAQGGDRRRQHQH